MPTTTIDDFERASLDHYTEHTSLWSTSTTRSTSGSRSLETPDGTAEGTSFIWSSTGSGLNYYPQPGDTLRFSVYMPTDIPDEGAAVSVQFGGTGSGDTYGYEVNEYGVWLHYRDTNDALEIQWITIGGQAHQGAWTTHEIEWGMESNGEVPFTITITDANGDELESGSSTDTEFLSTARGVGFRRSGGSGPTMWVDGYEADTDQGSSAISVAGTPTGSTTATGAASRHRGLTRMLTTSAALTGQPHSSRTVSGSPDATATTTAIPTRARVLTDTLNGVADAMATPTYRIGLARMATAVGEIRSLLGDPGVKYLRSMLTGDSDTDATPTRARSPTASTSASSASSATPGLATGTAGTATGAGDTAGAAYRARTSPATATASGSLGGDTTVTQLFAGGGDATGELVGELVYTEGELAYTVTITTPRHLSTTPTTVTYDPVHEPVVGSADMTDRS